MSTPRPPRFLSNWQLISSKSRGWIVLPRQPFNPKVTLVACVDGGSLQGSRPSRQRRGPSSGSAPRFLAPWIFCTLDGGAQCAANIASERLGGKTRKLLDSTGGCGSRGIMPKANKVLLLSMMMIIKIIIIRTTTTMTRVRNCFL